MSSPARSQLIVSSTQTSNTFPEKALAGTAAIFSPSPHPMLKDGCERRIVAERPSTSDSDQQYACPGGFSRFQIAMRLRRRAERIRLIHADLHRAAGYHAEQILRGRRQLRARGD